MIDTLAISPCPNDTFAFHAWIHNLIPYPKPDQVVYGDIQHLNEWALEGRYPVSKISFNCLGKILDDYIMIPSGAALGFNCGPKLIARGVFSPEEVKNKTIAAPGRDTTAYLLLKALFGVSDDQVTFTTYEKIGEMVKRGYVDCGLIIHETRFTFMKEGLVEIVDVGEEWEKRYSLPIPLGCIVAKRSLGEETIFGISDAIAASLKYGWEHKEESEEYILEHSQDKTRRVVESHIDLYVNQESDHLSDLGKDAVSTLLNVGREAGILPESDKTWLLERKEVLV